MSHSEKDRLTGAPRWLWFSLGGATAVAFLVAAVVTLRPPAEQTELAQAAPIQIQDRELPSIEPDDASSLVTYPRQPGITFERAGDGAADPAADSTIPPAPDEAPPGTVAPPESTSESEAKLPPKPNSTTAVGLLAATKRAAGPEATNGSGEQKPQPPTNPPAVETDQLPATPRGADPTYAPAKTAADAATQTQFEKLIRELLELGWTAKAAGLRQAEEKFKTASELCPDDPRASYAHGLVLLKHNQYDEAIKQFDSVGKQGNPPHLPSFRAAIWLRTLRKSYEPAALDLVGLTRAWQAFEPGALPEWVQSDLVAWTGQMFGFLDGPVDSRSVDALIEKCAAEIGGMLTREQGELLKTAKNDVLDEYMTKASVQDKARLEAKRQQEKEADETKARLTEEATEAKKEKKQVEKSAEDLERSLKDHLGLIDAQFNGLAREYDRLDLRARNAANYVRSLDQEIAILINQRTQLQAEQNPPPSGKDNDTKKTGTPKTQPPPSTTNATQIFAISATIDLKNRDRLRYQADYDRMEIQARDVQRQGAMLLNRRQSLINDYQTTTGKLYKEKETLAAKEKFLERRKQAASKPATGSTGQVKALGQTAKALRTYVDFNLELEKQRLLDSFAKP